MQLLCCFILLSTLLAVDSAFIKAPFSIHRFFNANDTVEPCATKPMNGVKECLKKYYSIYGYDIDHMPKGRVFLSKLQYIEMAKEKKGVQYVCRNMDALTACLAIVEEAQTCQNIPSYEAMLGVDDENAEDYLYGPILGNFPLAISCADEKAYEEAYECFVYLDYELATAVFDCVKAAAAESRSGVDKCIASAHMVTCISALYAKKEGCWKEASKLFCKAVEAATMMEAPECKSHMLDCKGPFKQIDAAINKKKLQMPPRRLTPLTDALRYDVYYEPNPQQK